MNRNTFKRGGFTLIETMLYLALTTGLVVVLSLTSISLAEYRAHAYERSETLYAATFAIDAVRSLTQHSRSITAPEPGATGEQIVLIDADGQETTIRVADNALIVERMGDEHILLTTPQNLVTDILFERTGNPEDAILNISFTVVNRWKDDVSVHIEETIATRISL